MAKMRFPFYAAKTWRMHYGNRVLHNLDSAFKLGTVLKRVQFTTDVGIIMQRDNLNCSKNRVFHVLIMDKMCVAY